MLKKILIGGVTFIALSFIIVGIVFQIDDNKHKNEQGDNPVAEENNNQSNLKKIVCSYRNNDRGIKTTEIYTFTHLNDKLKRYSIVLKYEYSKETEELALRYKGENIKSQVEEVKDIEGVEITHTDKNYVIENSYNYDLVKLNNDSIFSVLPIYNLDDSVSNIVKEVESWQFSCK